MMRNDERFNRDLSIAYRKQTKKRRKKKNFSAFLVVVVDWIYSRLLVIFWLLQ